MSLDVLKTRLKENNLSGVFLFCGPEEYTKDHYADRIRKKVDASPLPEFNHIYFSASSGNVGELADAVDSVPYMWDSKLIEITDLDSARFSESELEDYERIFSDIPDYVTILSVLRYEEPKSYGENKESKKTSGINAFRAIVEQHGLVVDFNTEKSDKLVTWITRHFNAHEVKYDMNVPREIINVCGSDMYILQSEITKLTEVYSGTPLTVSDVKKFCCVNTAYRYFDIADALNRNDMVSAKKILESLNLTRDEITIAIGAIAKNYAQMFHVKVSLDAGKSYDAIAKDLKIGNWLVGKIARSVSSSDMRSLSYAITQLSNADMKIKSNKGNAERILELAFYRICTYGRKT